MAQSMLVMILIIIKRKRARNIASGLAFITFCGGVLSLAVDNLAKTLENLVHGA
jgi:hypothetical protein